MPGGEASAAFCERVAKLLAVEAAPATGSRGNSVRGGRRGGGTGPAAAETIAPLAGPGSGRGGPGCGRDAVADCKTLGSRSFITGTDQRRTQPSLASFSRTAPRADAKAIAVLAFSDLSVAHDCKYFSDGIREELLNVLAKVPGLKVSARTSAFYFKGRQVPIPEMAQKLGVASDYDKPRWKKNL